MKNRTIWCNVLVNPEDWKEGYKETAEINGWDEDIENEENLWRYIDETLAQYLDDERMNLNIETEGRIIAIADLGLWYGRRQGYQILGCNVNEIFNMSEDYNEYYSDGYNIRANCIYHDGANLILYRVIREDRNIDNLLNAIYNGELISSWRLNYYTKSLHPYVAKAYGW